MDCISSGKSDECEFGQPYQEFSRVLAILFAHNTDSSAIRTRGDIFGKHSIVDNVDFQNQQIRTYASAKSNTGMPAKMAC